MVGRILDYSDLWDCPDRFDVIFGLPQSLIESLTGCIPDFESWINEMAGFTTIIIRLTFN